MAQGKSRAPLEPGWKAFRIVPRILLLTSFLSLIGWGRWVSLGKDRRLRPTKAIRALPRVSRRSSLLASLRKSRTSRRDGVSRDPSLRFFGGCRVLSLEDRENGGEPIGGIPSSPNRILIVRLSALGDTALTLPLFFALRERFPDAEIGWVVGEAASPLLQHLPGLSRLHIWKKTEKSIGGIWRLAKEIQKVHYTVALDPQGLLKSALLPFLARIPLRIGFSRAPLDCREGAWLFHNRSISPPPERPHIADRTLFLLTGLGIEPPYPISLPLPLPIDPEARAKMAHWLSQSAQGRKKILVLGIGAGWKSKVWPAERVAMLARSAHQVGYGCVILWGPAEKEELPRWQEVFGEEGVLAPPTRVAEMVALLALANGYAGPDSAALHLAWLLGKPTFSWFGASDEARCAPYGPAHRVLTSSIPCRPCWKRQCPSPRCLLDLTPREALPTFQEWLSHCAS